VAETRAKLAGDSKKNFPNRRSDWPWEAEVQELIHRYLADTRPDVQKLELALRAAVFRCANDLVAWLLQQSADALDMAYQPRPGQICKGPVERAVQCLFGEFKIERLYYHDPKAQQGHSPADEALGLEGAMTPGLARLVCTAGSQQDSFQAAELDLREVGGIEVPARQIQRLVEKVGPAAQGWQSRTAQSGTTDAAVLYISGDGTGLPMRKEELVDIRGKQPDGKATTRQAYLGCVFTQHRRDEKGRPVRDWESTTLRVEHEILGGFWPHPPPGSHSPGIGPGRCHRFPGGWSFCFRGIRSIEFSRCYPDCGLLPRSRTCRNGAGGPAG